MRCVVCWFGISPTESRVVGNLEGVQLDHHSDTTPWRRFNSARPAEHFPWLNGLKKSTHWLSRPAKRCDRATTAETQWRGGRGEVKRIGQRGMMPHGGGGSLGVQGQMGRRRGRTGQAGATWLEETDEDWVLETAAAASSSPNGFFPQHTVVIMQFLNWGPKKKGNRQRSQLCYTFAQWWNKYSH